LELKERYPNLAKAASLPSQNQTQINHEEHEGHEVFYSSGSSCPSWLNIFLPKNQDLNY
jgi:hypothetical protein